MGFIAWLKSHKIVEGFKGMVKQQEIKAEIKANSEVCCPKCGSTQLSANKKGLGVVKTMVGAFSATGGLGLSGGIGARNVEITCLKCGNRFKAGK